MSCDRNRTRLFQHLGPQLQAALGESVVAAELLDTLFDVAASQAPPEDRAGQLAAAAAYQKLKARAAREEIDLYPHQSKSGLPAPEAVAAWAQVAALLDAVEGRRPLTGLAADVHQAVALPRVLAARQAWGEPVIGTTLAALRRGWGGDPARVVALRRLPSLASTAPVPTSGTLGDEEHAAFLREMTEALVADSHLAPDLAAAARQYLLLDEAEMLEPIQRARWGRVLAAVAGVGVGPGPSRGMDGGNVCPQCGRVWRGGHGCGGDDAAITTRVAAAIAEVLAEPRYVDADPDPSPYMTAERLLGDWMRVGTPDPPEGALGRLLTAMREADRHMIRRLSRQPLRQNDIDMKPLRNATLRTPLLFEGEAYIWENGYLYREEDYRRVADWGMVEQRHAGFPMRLHNTYLLASLDAVTMAMVMMGRAGVDHHALSFPDDHLHERYGTEVVKVAALRSNDVIILPCGCRYRVVVASRKAGPGSMERLHEPAGGCATHRSDTVTLEAGKSRFTRVNRDDPRFSMPTWPGSAGV